MDLELEWYENVRNGWSALCDRCSVNINKDEFFSQRNQRGVYCDKCWTYINLQKWKCIVCNSTGTHRSYMKIVKLHCAFKY